MRLTAHHRTYYSERASAVHKHPIGRYYYSRKLDKDDLEPEDILAYIESCLSDQYAFAVDSLISLIQFLQDEEREREDAGREWWEFLSHRQAEFLKRLKQWDREAGKPFGWRLFKPVCQIQYLLASVPECRKFHDELERPLKEKIKDLEKKEKMTLQYQRKVNADPEDVKPIINKIQNEMQNLKDNLASNEKRRKEAVADHRYIREDGSQPKKLQSILPPFWEEMRSICLETNITTKYRAHHIIADILSLFEISNFNGRPYSAHNIETGIETYLKSHAL